MRRQIGSYGYMEYEAIHESCFMIVEMWKSTPRNTYTQNNKFKSNSKKKNQNQPAIS